MHTSTRTRAVRTLLLTAAASTVIGGSAFAAGTTAEPSREAATVRVVKQATCERGELCTWQRSMFKGRIHRVDLRTANPGECVPLPEDVDGRSFANRTSRHVTVYQGRDCSTEGDFTTYPGEGSFAPQAPFVVRGIQIWD